MNTKKIKDYLNFEDYTQYLYDQYHISELDWVDSETCMIMCKFADYIEENYKTVLNIPFLLLAGKHYMEELCECTSCPVREEHFNHFEEFLLQRIDYFAAKN